MRTQERPRVTTQSRDTDPAVEARQLEAWRRMTPAEKLHVVSELVRASEELALAGIRQRHPHATGRELELRLAALRLDRETMVRWLGWDPEREGY
jgi:hypothetical protein